MNRFSIFLYLLIREELSTQQYNTNIIIQSVTFLHFINRVLTQKKQYGEIVLKLQAIMEVMRYFSSYMDIPQIKQLSDEVSKIEIELAQQITSDFKEAFSGQNPKHFTQLTEGCLVLSVLDPKVK